jgi:hypothetical protein
MGMPIQDRHNFIDDLPIGRVPSGQSCLSMSEGARGLEEPVGNAFSRRSGYPHDSDAASSRRRRQRYDRIVR